MPGAHEVLARLKAAGVRLACTTNKELRHAQRLLDMQGLSRCFDLVIGGDSLPIKKPDARVLRPCRHACSEASRAARRTWATRTPT